MTRGSLIRCRSSSSGRRNGWRGSKRDSAATATRSPFNAPTWSQRLGRGFSRASLSPSTPSSATRILHPLHHLPPTPQTSQPQFPRASAPGELPTPRPLPKAKRTGASVPPCNPQPSSTSPPEDSVVCPLRRPPVNSGRKSHDARVEDSISLWPSWAVFGTPWRSGARPLLAAAPRNCRTAADGTAAWASLVEASSKSPSARLAPEPVRQGRPTSDTANEQCNLAALPGGGG